MPPSTSAPRIAPAGLREWLLRLEVAAVRLRSDAARALALNDTEMLALTHLARFGPLSQAQLARLLELSSGGTASLVHRMERDGRVVRRTGDGDARVRMVAIAPGLEARLEQQYRPFVKDLDELLAQMQSEQVDRFLDELVRLAEAHADRGASPRSASVAPQLDPWG